MDEITYHRLDHRQLMRDQAAGRALLTEDLLIDIRAWSQLTVPSLMAFASNWAVADAITSRFDVEMIATIWGDDLDAAVSVAVRCKRSGRVRWWSPPMNPPDGLLCFAERFTSPTGCVS